MAKMRVEDELEVLVAAVDGLAKLRKKLWDMTPGESYAEEYVQRALSSCVKMVDVIDEQLRGDRK